MYCISIWNKLLWSDQIAVPYNNSVFFGGIWAYFNPSAGLSVHSLPLVPRLEGNPYKAIFRAGSNADSCQFESKHLWKTTKAIADARAFI